MKIRNKRELQQIASNYLPDTDFKDFMKVYKDYTKEPNSFLVNDTNLSSHYPLTLFRIGIFGVAHGWGRGKKAIFTKICYTYPTMMKLGTVIPYLKKFQKRKIMCLTS